MTTSVWSVTVHGCEFTFNTTSFYAFKFSPMYDTNDLEKKLKKIQLDIACKIVERRIACKLNSIFIKNDADVMLSKSVYSIVNTMYYDNTCTKISTTDQ